MKVTAPTDIEGRMLNCSDRLKFLAFSLYAISRSYDDAGPPQEPMLRSLSLSLEEIADEIEAIHNANLGGA